MLVFIARPTLASDSYFSRPICAHDFARVSQELTELDSKSRVLAKRGSTFTAKSRADLEVRQDQIDKLIATRNSADLDLANTYTKDILRVAQGDLEKQGYRTRIEKRPSFPYNDPFSGKRIQIPEREVLIIESGSASSPFAREIHALDTYVRERMSDPKFPTKFKANPFQLQLDPVMNSVIKARGLHRNPASSLGVGLSVNVHELVESMDNAIEIIRHEKRHLKAYFDVVTEKPTIYRGTLGDYQNQNLVSFEDRAGEASRTLEPTLVKNGTSKPTYKSYLPFDEIDAFNSNVRSIQQRLGRATEDFRSTLGETPRPQDSAAYRGYQESVTALRDEGLMQARKVERITEATLENIRHARSSLASVETISSGDAVAYPGVRQVAFRIGKPGTDTMGRTLTLLVPEEVASQGFASIKGYAQRYLNELESSVRRSQSEIQTRIDDLRRDPIDRVKPTE